MRSLIAVVGCHSRLCARLVHSLPIPAPISMYIPTSHSQSDSLLSFAFAHTHTPSAHMPTCPPHYSYPHAIPRFLPGHLSAMPIFHTLSSSPYLHFHSHCIPTAGLLEPCPWQPRAHMEASPGVHYVSPGRSCRHDDFPCCCRPCALGIWRVRNMRLFRCVLRAFAATQPYTRVSCTELHTLFTFSVNRFAKADVSDPQFSNP
jgi:hypothetical protein